MTKHAFDKIAAGLDDAIAYQTGDMSRAQESRPVDVRAVRERSRKTQTQFAAAFHIPVATLRDWEQGRRRPDAPARALLSAIAVDPIAVERMLSASR